jgi:hypothetical protein
MRETRHIYITNVPESVDRDVLKSHFERCEKENNSTKHPPIHLFSFGRIERIRQTTNNDCVVSYQDVRGATKALRQEHDIDGHRVECRAHDGITRDANSQPTTPVPPIGDSVDKRPR